MTPKVYNRFQDLLDDGTVLPPDCLTWALVRLDDYKILEQRNAYLESEIMRVEGELSATETLLEELERQLPNF